MQINLNLYITITVKKGEKMKVLIVGANGATGKHVVSQLLENGHKVKVVVRSSSKLSHEIISHENTEVIEQSILTIKHEALKEYLNDCDAIVSCLGHNVSFKGIYGKPRRLVTDAITNLCKAVDDSEKDEIKFVLMSSSGVVNHFAKERISFAQKVVVSLIRVLVPPHKDNEMAAQYLQTHSPSSKIKWVIVRPDSLINADEVTEYEVHPNPIRSAIFDAGKVSRINVGHFMADLLINTDKWDYWQGKTPVVYNRK